MNSARDRAMASRDRCQNIHDTANTNLANLAAYGTAASHANPTPPTPAPATTAGLKTNP